MVPAIATGTLIIANFLFSALAWPAWQNGELSIIDTRDDFYAFDRELREGCRRYLRAVRTVFEFDFVTTATPDQVVELMTDFSPHRLVDSRHGHADGGWRPMR